MSKKKDTQDQDEASIELEPVNSRVSFITLLQ